MIHAKKYNVQRQDGAAVKSERRNCWAPLQETVQEKSRDEKAQA